VAIAAVAFATIMWARGVRLQLTTASAAGVAIGLLMMAATVAMILGSSRATFLGHDLAKAVYLIISMTLMIAFTTRARAMNLEYRASLEREIVSARRDAELNQALLVSERAYNRARDLAERRLAQLADTSHDLRQPIAALRLAVDRLGFEGRTDEQHALQRALEYVENVLVQNLEHAADKESSGPDQTDEAADATASQIEVFPVSLLLQSVEAMFRREAEAKGLQFRIVGSSLTISGALTPLLRIVCNLVSNAIRFTSEGKIVVGMLRRGGTCEMVVADTGMGIAEGDRERLLLRSEKSGESAGHGLGLAIAHRLAAENGIAIAMSSAPGAGTCFRLRIP
jgi:signal transduction histidine kinase